MTSNANAPRLQRHTLNNVLNARLAITDPDTERHQQPTRELKQHRVGFPILPTPKILLVTYATLSVINGASAHIQLVSLLCLTNHNPLSHSVFHVTQRLHIFRLTSIRGFGTASP